jgi:hypothetical protein
MKLLMLIIKLLEPTPESCKDVFQQLPITAIIFPSLVSISEIKQHCNFFEVCA